MGDIIEQIEETADRVTVALDALLPRPTGPEERLYSAMRYAALGPGKRIRPFLVTQCGALVDAPARGLLRTACAVECVHAYSLIHDDLPCMDDDDMRRGRATVHRAYDEATAVLAGDALQACAFDILAGVDTHASGVVRSRLVQRLAEAAGPRGMVGGQMIDMNAAEHGEDIGLITRLQRMKTGALISFSAEAGVILAEAGEDARVAFEGFAHDLGLIYQIVDDLLDARGEPDQTGKAVRKDARQGKATFVSILGEEGALDRARRLAEQAKEHLSVFGSKASLLRDTVDYVLDRRS